MLRTTIVLTHENQKFWDHIIPKGQKGKLINFILDSLRKEVESDPQKLEQLIAKILRGSIKISEFSKHIS